MESPGRVRGDGGCREAGVANDKGAWPCFAESPWRQLPSCWRLSDGLRGSGRGGCFCSASNQHPRNAGDRARQPMPGRVEPHVQTAHWIESPGASSLPRPNRCWLSRSLSTRPVQPKTTRIEIENETPMAWVVCGLYACVGACAHQGLIILAYGIQAPRQKGSTGPQPQVQALSQPHAIRWRHPVSHEYSSYRSVMTGSCSQ